MKKYNTTGLTGLFRLIAVITGILFLTLLFIRCTSQETVPGEKLLGIVFNYEKSEVVLTVISKGCTGKADFSFSVKGHVVTVVRNKKDECKAMPEAVQFTYSLKEAGLDASKEYTIGNTFMANPNLAAIP
ncbi:MAG: hypothetical protein J0M10_10195 [Chitinophagales bacterium]|nr:hypothetical protein [Chitinophagales bacterium]